MHKNRALEEPELWDDQLYHQETMFEHGFDGMPSRR